MKNRNLIMATLIVLLNLGCQSQQDVVFLELVGTNDINSSLSLTPMESSFNLREGTGIFVENVSDYELIYFSADTNVKLIYYDGNQWIVIENNVVNIPSGDSYLHSTKGEKPRPLSISIFPLLPELKEPMKIRVLIIAIVMENDQPTDQKVAAYIDLVVEP